MSLKQSQDLFYSSHCSMQCGIGNHAWLPWLEVDSGIVCSDVHPGEIAQKSFLTRCANCGKQERWNV